MGRVSGGSVGDDHDGLAVIPPNAVSGIGPGGRRLRYRATGQNANSHEELSFRRSRGLQLDRYGEIRGDLSRGLD